MHVFMLNCRFICVFLEQLTNQNAGFVIAMH